jgi:hypothetical protein
MFTVVSTASEEGLLTYGQRFLDTFTKYWPGRDEVRLLFYTEGYTLTHPRVEVHDLAESSWLADFKQRYRNEPRATGRGGYRWEAIRFAHKVAAIISADLICQADYLLWLDADMVTHTGVDAADIQSWLPGEAWLSWLDRDPSVINFPECGFLLFNRKHPRHADAMWRMKNTYAIGQIFGMAETHDSYVWKQVVTQLGMPVRNLSGAGFVTMHPLINSPLGHWFYHLKGSRKLLRRSHASDLVVARNEPYWKGPQG